MFFGDYERTTDGVWFQPGQGALAMTEIATDPVKADEDAISQFFAAHEPFAFRLRVMKWLRLEYPNQGTQLSELEYALAVEARKAK